MRKRETDRGKFEFIKVCYFITNPISLCVDEVLLAVNAEMNKFTESVFNNGSNVYVLYHKREVALSDCEVG